MYEETSRDTIGNIIEARRLTDTLGLENLLVLTSDYHMPMTREVCDIVFGLPSSNSYKISFKQTGNGDLTPQAIKERLDSDKIKIDYKLKEWGWRDVRSFPEMVKRLLTWHGAHNFETSSLKDQPVKIPGY